MVDILERVKIMDVVLYTPTLTYGIVMGITKFASGEDCVSIVVRNLDLSSEQKAVPISQLIVVGKHPFPNEKGEN